MRVRQRTPCEHALFAGRLASIRRSSPRRRSGPRRASGHHSITVPAAAPAQTVATKLAAHVPEADLPVVICAKRIEQGTGAPHDRKPPHPLSARATLMVPSGPSFAGEVAQGPAHGPDPRHHRSQRRAAAAVAEAIGSRSLRPITLSSDLIGAQVGGAVKNVLAIACGICDGAEPGRQRQGRAARRGASRRSSASPSPVALSAKLSWGFRAWAIWCRPPRRCSRATTHWGWRSDKGAPWPRCLGARRSVTEGVTTSSAVVDPGRAAQGGYAHLCCGSRYSQSGCGDRCRHVRPVGSPAHGRDSAMKTSVTCAGVCRPASGIRRP